MTAKPITFPPRFTEQLPPSIRKVQIFSRVPPLSGRTKAACAATFVIGLAMIALFAASVAGQQNPQFAAIWKRLGPGITAFDGVAGVMLVGGAITPPICASAESTARKIAIYEYLKNPETQKAIDELIASFEYRAQVDADLRSLMDPQIIKEGYYRPMPNTMEVPLTGDLSNVFLLLERDRISA